MSGLTGGSGGELLCVGSARSMHKFSTAATKSSGVLHRQRCATRKRVPRGLLNVLKSTFAGAAGPPRAGRAPAGAALAGGGLDSSLGIAGTLWWMTGLTLIPCALWALWFVTRARTMHRFSS